MVATISIGNQDIRATQVALADLGFRIRSFREPFNQAIREELVPAISANFATQGHGKWPPLASSTVEYKALNGFPNRMLVRTKRMITEATSIKAWEFGGGRDSIALKLNTPYARWHIEGVPPRMPKRDFTELDEAVVDEVRDVFATYIALRIAKFHAKAI